MTEFRGNIRELWASDKEAWLPLSAGYLEFYKSSVPPDVTELTFSRLLDPGEPMFALLAELDGRVIGLTQCVLHRSTWTRGPYLYLNDLFVLPSCAAAAPAVP